MNQKKIGEFLKELRKEKGLTQEQLAEKFYVSNRTVSRWETGSNLPDISTLIELADFYNCDIREIINGERKSENMNEEEKKNLKAVAEYAEEDKATLLKRVRTTSIVALLRLCCAS
ncbi:MAG: helix-turn-helix domain-containing protein [Ruminococcus sp.]|nr:helix-turn-helix domain-containing protein [Ruminococcus sp.]